MGPEYPSALQSFVASDPNSPLVLQAQWRLETLQQVAKEQEEKGAGQSGKMSRIPRFGCFSGIRQKLQGVAKDLEEARKWYIQAVAKGDVVAKKKLSELSGAH